MTTQEDKVDTTTLFTIGIVLALATVAIALVLTALVRNEVTELEAAKGASANLHPVRELREKQRAALRAAPVPIERAKQLVIERLARDPAAATEQTPAVDAGADVGTAREEAGDERRSDRIGDKPDDPQAGGVTPTEAVPR